MNWSAFRTSFLCCSVLLILPAGSAAYAKDTWTGVQSQHFYLAGNADEKDIRRIALKLEQFRSVFVRLLNPAQPQSPIPVHVIVFRNQADFQPFMPVINGRTIDVGGYYLSNREISYITLTADFRQTSPYAMLLHEYIHTITNNLVGNLPAWLDEGLAEFYSTVEITDGDQRVQLGNAIEAHVRTLREQQLMPLAHLFAIDHGSPEYSEGEKRGLFYAQSWALVHYLMLGSKGTRYPQLMEFMRLLRTGQPTNECFRQAFQTDLVTLEEELRNYLGRDRFETASQNLPEKIAFATEMQSATISEAEWNYHLGDLLRHAERTECETYLTRALTLDPQLASAHASLGMWRMRQGRNDEAREHLQRAAADTRHPTEYLTLYYYAWLLIHEGGSYNVIRNIKPANVPLIRAALEKATKLKPDFAEPWYLLGFVSLLTGEQLEAAVSALERAIALAPARDDFRLQLANLHTRLSRYSEARQTLIAIAQRSADPQSRTEAQTMLESVERQMKFIAEHLTATSAQGADTSATASTESTANEGSPPPKLRHRQAEEQITGLLTRISCDEQGITLYLSSGRRAMRFHARNSNNIKVISRIPSIGTELPCQEFSKPPSVIVGYRATTDAAARHDGELLTVEFVSAP